jgi:peptide/nickel transport system substrate-binding protein
LQEERPKCAGAERQINTVPQGKGVRLTMPRKFALNHLVNGDILDRAMTRRSLFGAALKVGAAASTASLLAACADDDDVVDDSPAVAPDDDSDDEPLDDAADDTDDDEPADGPQQGGRIRIATRGAPDILDPQLRVTVEEAMVNLHVYSGLVRASSELEPVPELAESWDSNDDGDVWTFNLRSGVEFQNGRELTAQDVVDTFNRILDPDTGSPYLVQIEMIDEIEAPDDTTAIFHLNRPYGGLPDLLCNDFALIIPVEEADTLRDEPIGSGAYRVQRRIPGERTVLVRNEDYWNTENQPYLEEIHFIVMAEETTRMTALQGGDIDLIVDIFATSVPMIANAANVEYQEIVTGTHITIIMTATEEPWTDVRVRQALKLCLDRESVLQAAVQGFGATAADQPIPPTDPMYPDLPIPERDIERAQELLAEAGYPDGIDIDLHTSPGRPGMQEVALAVQEMAGPAGFNIEVQSHPIDQYWADIWMQRPFNMSNWNLRLPSDQMLQVTYMSGANWNETFWENPEFDDLVMQAQGSTDPDERYEYMQQACRLLAEDGAVGIPIFRSGIDAWNTRIKNFEPHPMRWMDLHQVWIEE